MFTARPFVGRQGEIALLRRALKEAVAGDGALFMISGADGVGKSSIVKWPRDAQVSGVRCIFANERSVISDVTKIGGKIAGAIPVVPAEQPLCKGSSSPHDSSSRADVLRRETVFGKIKITQPTLLILEDIHSWSTKALAAVRLLEQLIGQASVLAVATYGEAEIRRDLRQAPTVQRFEPFRHSYDAR